LRALTSIWLITILGICTPELSAQEATEPDPIEAMAFRFGPLGVSPTLSVTNFGFDTNVFNNSVDPRTDFTFRAAPRLQARLRSRRTLLSGTIETGLNYYAKYSDERFVDFSGNGRADFDFDRFRPYLVASRLDTRERLNAEVDARAPRVQTDVAAGARFRATSKMSFTVEARRMDLQFDEGVFFEGVPLSEMLNSTTSMVDGGVEFQLTPLTTLSLVATTQQDRFDESPERDSDTFRLMPTIRLEAPAIIQGSFSAGYRSFKGLNPELPDYSGLVLRGSLGRTFVERTRVELLVSRDVQYSFEETQPYYLTTGLRVTVTHLVREALDIRAAAGRDRFDYRDQVALAEPLDERRDVADVVSIGFGYRPQPHIRFGLDLEFGQRTSDRSDRNYDRTRLLGSFSYGI
jgi:hypothetical protein